MCFHMIPQIFITDYLSAAAVQPADLVRAVLSACPLLAKADWQLLPHSPVQQLLQALQPAYQPPLAAVLQARLVRPEGRAADAGPPFALLPVHLAMRRDTYSLNNVLCLSAPVFARLTACLQQHFVDDFELVTDPTQRYWWLWPKRAVLASSPWPQEALFQQAMHWQPRGPQASVIRQWSNEMQMLLHTLASSHAEPDWPDNLNSLWLASAQPAEEPAPATFPSDGPVLFGRGAVFDGLVASGYPHVQTDDRQAWLKQATRTGLWVEDDWQQFPWADLQQALQATPSAGVQVVLPFAERSVWVRLSASRRWQFWRRPVQADACIQALETALTQTASATSP